MNEYLSLTKALIASLAMSKPQDKRRRIMFGVISAFVIVLIILPVFAGGLFFVKFLTQALVPFGMQHLSLGLVYHIICLFSVVFGINVIFSEFYFSSDLEYIRPLPLRAAQIAGAKFSVSYYVDNLMQFALVGACVIGFALSADMNVVGYISAVVSIVTLPIVPLTYCSVICMLIMAFSRFVRNREIIQKSSAFVLAAGIVALAIFAGYVKSHNVDVMSLFITPTGSTFVDTMNFVFPSVRLIVMATSDGSIVALLGYLIVNVVAVLIMLGVSQLVYFKGFENISGNSAHSSADMAVLLKKSKQHSPAFAYFQKEVRILLRTPAFFTNCVAVNYLWPALIYVIVRFQSYDISGAGLRAYYSEHTSTAVFALMSASIIISLIISAMNSISSNSISREGKHFQFMKYIPVTYETQWDIKVLVAGVFSISGIWIYLIPLFIIMRVGLGYSLLCLFLSLMSVAFVSFLGVYLDSVQPKLVWDDELGALRENTNVVFTMGISLVLALALGGCGYALYGIARLNTTMILIIYTVVLSLLNLFVIFTTYRSGNRNIAEQEEM